MWNKINSLAQGALSQANLYLALGVELWTRIQTWVENLTRRNKSLKEYRQTKRFLQKAIKEKNSGKTLSPANRLQLPTEIADYQEILEKHCPRGEIFEYKALWEKTSPSSITLAYHKILQMSWRNLLAVSKELKSEKPSNWMLTLDEIFDYDYIRLKISLEIRQLRRLERLAQNEELKQELNQLCNAASTLIVEGVISPLRLRQSIRNAAAEFTTNHASLPGINVAHLIETYSQVSEERRTILGLILLSITNSANDNLSINSKITTLARSFNQNLFRTVKDIYHVAQELESTASTIPPELSSALLLATKVWITNFYLIPKNQQITWQESNLSIFQYEGTKYNNMRIMQKIIDLTTALINKKDLDRSSVDEYIQLRSRLQQLVASPQEYYWDIAANEYKFHPPEEDLRAQALLLCESYEIEQIEDMNLEELLERVPATSYSIGTAIQEALSFCLPQLEHS